MPPSTPPTPPDGTRTRLTTLLLASTVGVYCLILVGVTNALTSAAAACPTWPACAGWSTSLTDPRVIIVLGHRLAALAVGGLLLATAVVAWRQGLDRRTAIALGVAVVGYPFEVWIGALAAVGVASTGLEVLHLVVAVVIFTGLLAALGWQLEVETPPAPELTAWIATAGTTEPSRPTERPVDAPSPPMTVARPVEPAGEPRRPSVPLTTRLRAYLSLTKPRLWWLLCLVALASMVLAAGGVPPMRTTVATLVGGVLAIAASGTFNHVLERDRDERMARTDDRPLVSAVLPVRNAVAFGLALMAASVATFLVFVNALAAGLGLLAILFYSLVYTVVLKPNTTQNTVLGGAVGAFPALIGWAAVTHTVGVPALVLGAVIFLWTPAHFYNLALVYKADYGRAGFPMLPVVRGDATTRRHILAYLGATMTATAVLATSAGLDWPFVAVALVGGAGFLWAVVRLFREQSDRAAFRAFMASNGYLGLLLVAILVDAVLV